MFDTTAVKPTYAEPGFLFFQEVSPLDPELTMLKTLKGDFEIGVRVAGEEWYEKKAYLCTIASYEDEAKTKPVFSEMFLVEGVGELEVLQNLALVTDLAKLHRRAKSGGYVEAGVIYCTLQPDPLGGLIPHSVYFHFKENTILNPDKLR